MAFAPTAELFYAGDWHTVPLRENGQLTIQDGRSPESRSTGASTCQFTIDNRTQLWSPLSPLSPLYDVGRYTPVRVTFSAEEIFHGEVAKWEPDTTLRPPSGTVGDAWVRVTANGIRRRYAQGKYELQSGFYRWMADNATYYWPLDKPTTTPREFPQIITASTPSAPILQNFSNYSNAEAIRTGANMQVPWIESGLSLSDASGIRTQPGVGFDVPISTTLKVAWVCRRTQPGGASGSSGLFFTVDCWKFDTSLTTQIFSFGWGYNTGSGVSNQLYLTIMGSSIVSGSARSILTTSGPLLFIATLTESGANIDYTLEAVAPDTDETTVLQSGTRTTVSLPDMGPIFIDNAWGVNQYGHVAAFIDTAVTSQDIVDAFNGHATETQADRFARVCDELDIAHVELGGSVALGPQYPGQFEAVLSEIETIEPATMVIDTPDARGLTLVGGDWSRARPADLTLDYAQAQVAAGTKLALDDLSVRNDITMRRRDGGEIHVEQETGPNNINDPEDDPQGASRIAETLTVNAVDDSALSLLANWRLHVFTSPDNRFPTLIVDYGRFPALAVVPVGGRIDIVNIPPGLAPNAGRLLVTGRRRTITAARHLIEYQCRPYGPYATAVWGVDDTGSQWGSATASLTAGIDEVDTSFQVTDTQIPWSTTATGYDIDVGGERMTVVSVVGASSPQTFTVTRSVNGVVKSHDASAKVSIVNVGVYAL